MPLDQGAFSQPLPLDQRGSLPVVLVGSEHETVSPDMCDALADADVVFFEEGVERGILALVSAGVLVEPVSDAGAGTVSREAALFRASTLASDGWRVVWIASANAPDLRGNFDGGGTAAFNAAIYRPHALATALNGLAG
jgi:hypothetical protein